MNKLLLSMLFACMLNAIFAQPKVSIHEDLTGHWEGGFIKNNAQQRIDIQFYKKGEQLICLQIMEEWHPQYGEFELPVLIDSSNVISFNTGLGKANLQLDKEQLEIHGMIENTNPTIYLHLKKVPSPPQVDYEVQAVQFKNNDVELSGHLHFPKYQKATNAIVIVGGRGCYAGSTKYDLYAKLLRSYGMAVLVFNKRGTGKSTGDCNSARIEDLAADVIAAQQFLKQQYQKVGALGSSAGGWVIMKAHEQKTFDFLISVVGPSTSVKEQQFQSMEYGIKEYQLSNQAMEEVRTYTQLMYEAPATKKAYEQFQRLLAKAKTNGWNELLDDTDQPTSITGIDSLWVRRHAFNPKDVISKLEVPYLAIYGGKDWIVPYKENAARLQELLKEDQYSLIVAPKAGHSTEISGEYITLSDQHTYWHFFRISPLVNIGIIQFLREHKFVE